MDNKKFKRILTAFEAGHETEIKGRKFIVRELDDAGRWKLKELVQRQGSWTVEKTVAKKKTIKELVEVAYFVVNNEIIIQ